MDFLLTVWAPHVEVSDSTLVYQSEFNKFYISSIIK